MPTSRRSIYKPMATELLAELIAEPNTAVGLFDEPIPPELLAELLAGGPNAVELLAELIDKHVAAGLPDEPKAAELPDKSNAVAAELLAESVAWEHSVGLLFAEVLLAGSPADLCNIQKYFGSLETVVEPRKSRLINCPATQSGGPIGRELCEFGITPLTVLHAIRGVDVLVYRLLNNGFIDAINPIFLGMSETDQPKISQRLDLAVVVGGIKRYAICSQEMATCLLPWLIQLARHCPQLFLRFKAEQCGKNGLLLSFVPDMEHYPREKRWSIRSLEK